MKTLLSEDEIAPLRRYIDKRIPPGGFLTAVLANDLFGAFERADKWNRELIGEYVDWVYNNAPIGCWGTYDRVQEWLKGA